jgi:glycosyltransferase involved in cell wall biosynthesis
MTNTPLVSIIIPTYNRAYLIGETLDSVLAQTYTNWECIVVDDQSTDRSYEVIKCYEEQDKRFKAFVRPSDLRKGANSCRNYGFLQAQGAYIKWFDSDDVMLPEHLDVACHKLVGNKLDFVVTDTINFNHETGEFAGKPYEFDRSNAIISARNIALMKIGWITDDFLGKREILQNITFNERLEAGQEYNFFVRLLNHPIQGVFIDQVLTHRRIHSGAISVLNKGDDLGYLYILATIKYQTANDLVIYKNTELIRWFLSGYMQYAFKLAFNRKKIPFCFQGYKMICSYYSVFKGIAFLLALLTARYLKKGFNIMKYARK